MAEKKPAAATAAVDAKPKLPLLPILGAALGSAALVGGLMFFMMPKAAPADGDEAAEQAGEGDAGDGEARAETRYVEVKEPLVVNLTGPGPRFLQAHVQLATRSEEGQKAIEAHLPAIRSALLILLRQTSAEDLARPDIMVELQDKTLAEANRVLEAETGEGDIVSALLFTSFVTQ